MARRARRRGLPRFGGLRLWLVVAATCVTGLLYYRPVHAYVETRHTLARRSAEVRALAATKRALEQRLALTESDATLVRAARQLGLVKPGERLFIVKDIAQWRRAHAARRSR